MAKVRVDCINKPDRYASHEGITHVGGPQPQGAGGRWKQTTAETVRQIESKQNQFYVAEGGRAVEVAVRVSPRGHKFLQTHADGIWNDNLLALRGCG